MKKKASFLLAATLLLSSSTAFAQHTLNDGVLQAYWQSEWNKDATKITSQLKMRYIVHNDGSAPTMVVDVPVDKQDKKNRTFITKHFSYVPTEFFQNKEGYLNQPGTLTVPSLTKAFECTSAYKTTQLSSFVPDMSSGLADTTTDEKFINCGERHPYLTFYRLSPNQKDIFLKAAPDDSAANTIPIGSDTLLAKLHTVNKEWAYVAFYDARTLDQIGEQKGYVRLNTLLPLKKAPPVAAPVRHRPKPCWYPRATHDKVMRDRHCRFSS
ncbi:hypothetical protein [Zymobacter sp. IVIA_12111.31 C1]|uniref:hypothetical protein n=1 Tax=Zymobacter sp. IVIA_12111.31 C1 TaxID=3394854 RepID=UPI0039C1D9A7